MEKVAIPATDSPLGIAICDDSKEDRNRYAKLIRGIAAKNDIRIHLYFFQSGAAACFEMEDLNKNIDILFMDISMPEEDGLSVSRKLRQADGAIDYNGELIFLTKSTSHAIEAFDVNAFHYIVKDKTPMEKFEEILLNAAKRVAKRHRKTLLLRGVGEYRSIDVDSILYFEIQHHIITVHYGWPEQTFEFYCSMDKLEKTVFPFMMLRNHKSFIVQVRQIKSLTYSKLTLTDDMELPVGRAYYKNLKAIFEAQTANSDVQVESKEN